MHKAYPAVRNGPESPIDTPPRLISFSSVQAILPLTPAAMTPTSNQSHWSSMEVFTGKNILEAN